MNYQNWSKKKFWLVLLGVFILGLIMAPKSNPVQVKETIKEVPVIKEVVREVTKEVCSKENEWRQLKNIDDEGFNLAADGFYTISGMFTAISNNDMTTFSNGIADLKDTTIGMDNVNQRRQVILKSLGY